MSKDGERPERRTPRLTFTNTDLAAVAAAEMERHIRGLVASVNLLRDRLGMDMLTLRHVQRPVRKEQ